MAAPIFSLQHLLRAVIYALLMLIGALGAFVVPVALQVPGQPS